MKFLAIIPALVLCGSLGAQIQSTQTPRADYHILSVKSPALSPALTPVKVPLKIHVLLPPAYQKDPARRFPVVYFLPGFGDDPKEIEAWTQNLKASSWNFILVGVEGRTPYGGGFYVDSPASGSWETFIIQELVPWIDQAYRTLPGAPSRGLAGFSMGGFGALNLGLRHPEVFSTVLASAPGILMDELALRQAWDDWESFGTFIPAYAEAFSPDPQGEEFFGRTPGDYIQGQSTDSRVFDQWLQGFGQWKSKIQTHLALKKPLKKIKIEWGNRDGFLWIRNGSPWVAQEMRQAGLNVIQEPFSGGHSLSGSRVAASWVPFFQENLKF